MAIQFVGYTPTASQYASAASHLELRSEWRTFRVDGIRYVAMPSANSQYTHVVRADAQGCDCLWYTRTLRLCSHMLSLELDAMEEELRETQPAPATAPHDFHWYHPDYAACLVCNRTRNAYTKDEVCSGKPAIRELRGRFEDLWPTCVICGDLADGRDERCATCASDLERQQRMDSQRVRIEARYL